MKRLFFLLVAIIALASCSDSSISGTYTLTEQKFKDNYTGEIEYRQDNVGQSLTVEQLDEETISIKLGNETINARKVGENRYKKIDDDDITIEFADKQLTVTVEDFDWTVISTARKD